jgi:WD40 repeat protein
VSSIACSPDGETVAIASEFATLLNLRTGTFKATWKPVTGNVLAVAFSSDGRMLAGAGLDSPFYGGYSSEGRVTLWDIRTSKILHTLKGPTGPAQTVAFSPDGQTVAAGGLGPMKAGRGNLELAFSYSGRASEVRLWDAATGQMLWRTQGDSNGAQSLSFPSDGKALAFLDSNYLFVVNPKTGKLRNVLMETTTRFPAQDRSPDEASARPGGH